MKNLLIIFILNSSGLFGQMSDSLKSYYYYVNKAELEIVGTNYCKAIEYYSTAFLLKDFPFHRDIYNQAICNVLVEEYMMAHNNFRTLLDYGYTIDSLLVNEELSDFFISKYGKKLIREAAKGIQPSYNVNLRHRYDSILAADQFFREKDRNYQIYGDTINKIDEQNANLLHRLIMTYGFPTENLIGSFYSFDYHPFKIVVIHNQVGVRGKRFDFTNILYEATYNGELDSRVALQLVTGSTGNDMYGFSTSGIIKHGLDTITNKKNKTQKLTSWGVSRVKPELESEYNKKRSEIGLCNINDERKKIIYNLEDTRFYLVPPAGKKIFLWATEEDYLKALENLTYIK